MAMPDQPWRVGLGPASFRGAFFHYDVQGRGGGRRVAPHEYPKRDTPYAEDMGRASRIFRVTGYCIGPDYIDKRDALTDALEAEGPGTLILPRFSSMLVMVTGFTSTEVRERGGYVTFDMTFMEAGLPGFSQVSTSTAAAAAQAAQTAIQQSTAGLNQFLARQ